MSTFPATRELVGILDSKQIWAVIYIDRENRTAELVTVTGPAKKVTVSIAQLIPYN